MSRLRVGALLLLLLFSSSVATGGTTFQEVGASKGLVPYNHAEGSGPTSALTSVDYDGDGDVDLFVVGGWSAVPSAADENRLYRNNGAPTFDFTEVTLPSAMAARGDNSRAALWFDYDLDGDQDLVVGRDCRSEIPLPASTPNCTTLFPPEPKLRLFRQDSPTSFTEVTQSAGDLPLTSWFPMPFQHLGGIVAGDFNGDGTYDLFVGIWDAQGAGDAPVLLLNNGDGTFTDETVAAGLDLPSTYQSVLASDFDDDGRYDLFLSGDGPVNRLMINQGNDPSGVPTFVDRAADAGVDHGYIDPVDPGENVAMNEMGIDVADVNNDGLLDMYVTNIFRPPGATLGTWNSLYVNGTPPGGGLSTYSEVAREAGVDECGWGWGAVFFDMDNDGDVDIATTNGKYAGGMAPVTRTDSSCLFENLLESGVAAGPVPYPSFGDLSSAAGFDDTAICSALTAFDVDHDGDLDLGQVCWCDTELQDCTTNGATAKLNLYENELETQIPAASRNYLFVEPCDNDPALDGFCLPAIGARVVAQLSDGTRLTRELTAGNSTHSQEPSRLHFGIGAETHVPLLQVRYLGGRPLATVTDVTAGNTVTVACDDEIESLTVARSESAPGKLDLSWRGSCRGTETDYEILSGPIPDWNTPTLLESTTGGLTTREITPAAPSTFYVVRAKS